MCAAPTFVASSIASSVKYYHVHPDVMFPLMPCWGRNQKISTTIAVISNKTEWWLNIKSYMLTGIRGFYKAKTTLMSLIQPGNSSADICVFFTCTGIARQYSFPGMIYRQTSAGSSVLLEALQSRTEQELLCWINFKTTKFKTFKASFHCLN